MTTKEIAVGAVFENALLNIRDEIKITKWTKNKERRRELRRLAKEIRKDRKRLK